MTTVAFDGRFMASDSLATDSWGLKEYTGEKITVLPGMLIGAAGESGQIRRWLREVRKLPTVDAQMILDYGYPTYNKDSDDPSLMLFVSRGSTLYRCVSGMWVPTSRLFHAVGSGRDYALAAMACGKTAHEAVQIAMAFDNGTGGDIRCVSA